LLIFIIIIIIIIIYTQLYSAMSQSAQSRRIAVYILPTLGCTQL